MTRQQFQDQHGANLKAFIEGPSGPAFLSLLGSMRPAYEFPKEEHLLSENRGAMRGYELCIRNIISMSVVIQPNQEPEANYGVPNKKD